MKAKYTGFVFISCFYVQQWVALSKWTPTGLSTWKKMVLGNLSSALKVITLLESTLCFLCPSAPCGGSNLERLIAPKKKLHTKFSWDVPGLSSCLDCKHRGLDSRSRVFTVNCSFRGDPSTGQPRRTHTHTNDRFHNVAWPTERKKKILKAKHTTSSFWASIQKHNPTAC